MSPLHVLEDLQKTYRLLVETFQDITDDDIRAWMHDPDRGVCLPVEGRHF